MYVPYVTTFSSAQVNEKFADMHKAFQFIDQDKSGTLDRAELTRALELWQVPLPPGGVDALISQCDADGDGSITYNEFVKVRHVCYTRHRCGYETWRRRLDHLQ